MTIGPTTDPNVSGYPIEMPFPNKMVSMAFNILRDEVFNPQISGGGQVIRRSSPVWVGSWSTTSLQPEDYGTLRAWLDSLDGSIGTFLGYDARRSMPIKYVTQPGTTPWGSMVISGASFANSTLSYTGATAGFQLERGDYISFKDGNIWYLYRVYISHTVPGSGAGDISVSPRPPALSTLAPFPVRLERPAAEMRLLPNTTTPEDTVQNFGHIAFKAVQYINYETAAV